VLEIAFHADRSSAVPLGRQLAEQLAGLISSGRLPAGSRLPATRELAEALGLGRKTVTAAYEVLAGRGLIRSRVGQGTFVATATPMASPPARPPVGRPFAWAGLFARSARTPWPAALREDLAAEYRFDFRAGRIDPGALPIQDLRWAFARPFESRARLRALAAHYDPFGWPPLRRELARYLVARGIECDPADIAIVNGLQHAIELSARVLLDPGDAAVVEQPGYFGATLAIAARGADRLAVDVDDDGLDTTQLARMLRLRRVKVIYVTPATQSPTGVALSPARRAALLALADEYQVPVFEDDYDCELRYAGPSLPALKATDAAGQVIYAGTFSKVLFPSLRLGYVVAAQPLLERMVAAHAATSFGTNVVVQAAMATLLATRGLERHVYQARKRYGARLAALQDGLARHMPATVRWTTPRSGHVVWVTLPAGIDAERLQQAALAAGVAYTRGEAFFGDGRGAAHLALAFTAIEPAAIAAGVETLAALVAAQTTVGRRARRAGSRGPHASAAPGTRKERRHVGR
jgi:GntR family transcriptional regulator/MocR family aminotransferase